MLSNIGNQFRKPRGFLGRIISKLMIKGNSREYDKLIPILEIQPHDRLLEIGYGHGLGIDRILSKYDCHISGIDFSELMYRQANKRNRRHIDDNKATLHFGDFLNFELPVSTFDKIYFLNVIYFWNDLEIPFSRIRSALKSGGICCFSMAHRDDLNRMPFTKDGIFNKYTIEEVTGKLKLSGFNEIEYELDGGYYIKCRK